MKWTRLTVAAILGFGLVSVPLLHAQTIIFGNISGTWSPSGNPYIVSDNATVPTGQTLTIQPGVVVWIGAGVSVNVYGNIQAIGTASQRITIQNPNSSQYWNEIHLYNIDVISVTNRFYCCDVSGATNAIADSLGYNMRVEIMNCTFSNCVSSAVFGQIPALTVSLVISGNIFNNMAGTALSLKPGNSEGSGNAVIINNVMANCAGGVNVSDQWNAQIESCVFKGCTIAVKVSSLLSRTVNNNDFFGNATNFVGYPSSYGNPIIVNRNGTPCDLLLNIFQDPQFVSATDFHLQGTSPCIDAGEGGAAYFDNSFPPSLGTVTNDIGAYGGLNAGQWLNPAPSSFLTLAAARYVGVTIYPPSAGHYELDYASALAGTNNWIQITNMDLSAPFLYTEPMSSPARFFRAEKLY
jgi:hypothetical protein